jgi:hypothetical protein
MGADVAHAAKQGARQVGARAADAAQGVMGSAQEKASEVYEAAESGAQRTGGEQLTNAS